MAVTTEGSSISDTASLRRNGLIAGLVAAVLFVAGYLVGGVVPGGGTTEDKTITDFYNGHGPQAALVLALVAAVAGICLIWFFTTLAARLGDTVGTRVGHSLAIAGSVMFAAGAFIICAPSAALKFSDATFVGIPAAIAIAQAGLGVMIIGGMWTLAVAVAVMSLSARGSASYPNWLVWTGVVIAVLMIGSFFWVPGLLLAVWLLAAAIAGFRTAA